MTPTTDTLWGWLILSVLAVGTVGMAFVVGAAVLAVWDAVLLRHRKRVEFDREMAEQRSLAFGYCRVIEVDGHPVRIHSDVPEDDRDRAIVDTVVRILRYRLQELVDEELRWAEIRS